MAASERRVGSVRRGMTLLGRIPTAAPKPINLPSQRLENQGLVPDVDIVPKGTFSWGSTSRLPCVSGNIGKNGMGAKAEGIVASKKEGERCLVEKATRLSSTESCISPPSSAGSNGSDVASNISFNSVSSESWDDGIRVYPRSTSGSESGSSSKNVKHLVQSTSGAENTGDGLDTARKLEDTSKSRAYSSSSVNTWVQRNEQISDPPPDSSNDGVKRGGSKPHPGCGASDDDSKRPPLLSPGVLLSVTQEMPCGPGAPYSQVEGSYSMTGMPIYSGAKDKEIVVIHMYGHPGFYGGYFPYSGFLENYGRPVMYGQFPLQYGQIEHFFVPGHGMLDGGSQVSAPFFVEQPAFAPYANGTHEDHWAYRNSRDKDFHCGKVEMPPMISSAFGTRPPLSNYGMQKKAGRRKTTDQSGKGFSAKSSTVMPLPEKRVTFLTKVSRHEVIINNFHEESQDSVTESAVVSLNSNDDHAQRRSRVIPGKIAGDETKINDGADVHKLPTSNNVDQPQPDDMHTLVGEGNSNNVISLRKELCSAALETVESHLSVLPSVMSALDSLADDKDSCRIPSKLETLNASARNSSISSTGWLYPASSASSKLDAQSDDSKDKTVREMNCFNDRVGFVSYNDAVENAKIQESSQYAMNDFGQKQNDALDRCLKRWKPRGTGVSDGNGSIRRRCKQFTAKSQMGRKVFVPKIKKAIKNRIKNNNSDDLSTIQNSSTEVLIPQSTSCWNNGVSSGKSVKETYGSTSAITCTLAKKAVDDMTLFEGRKRYYDVCGSTPGTLDTLPERAVKSMSFAKEKNSSKPSRLHITKLKEACGSTPHMLCEIALKNTALSEDSQLSVPGHLHSTKAKEACGSTPGTTGTLSVRSVENTALDKHAQSAMPSGLNSTKSSGLLVPDNQTRNMKWKKVHKTVTDDFYKIASEQLIKSEEQSKNTRKESGKEGKPTFKDLKGSELKLSSLVVENRKQSSERYSRRITHSKKVFLPKVQKLLNHNHVDIHGTDIPSMAEPSSEIIFPQTDILETNVDIENPEDSYEEIFLSEAESKITDAESEEKDVQSLSYKTDTSLCTGNAKAALKIAASICPDKIAKPGKSQEHSESQMENKVHELAAFVAGFDDIIMRPSKSEEDLKNQKKGGCEQRIAQKKPSSAVVESGKSWEHLKNPVKVCEQGQKGTCNRFPGEWILKVPNAMPRKWKVKQQNETTYLGRKVFMQKTLKQSNAPKNARGCITVYSPIKSNIETGSVGNTKLLVSDISHPVISLNVTGGKDEESTVSLSTSTKKHLESHKMKDREHELKSGFHKHQTEWRPKMHLSCMPNKALT